MSTTTLQLPGLPPGVEVRASFRREQTVSAFREFGRTVVVVPASLSAADIHRAVAQMVRRLDRDEADLGSDDALRRLADRLRTAYLPEVSAPARVRWSTRQRKRWGSCTPSRRTIRVSALLRGAPRYVVSAVLVHELAHLLHRDHGPEFQSLVRRFPEHDRAEAFLSGATHARARIGA
ncbi:MAG: M48 family metallopeptidase [Candidatus Nanopelagicales bacterium]